MNMMDRAKEARAHRDLQNHLQKVREQLKALLQRHAQAARQAAKTILRQAREIWEHERHFDASGWVRRPGKVEQMFDLQDRMRELRCASDWTWEQEQARLELGAEYEALCEQLGVLSALGNPDQHTIRAIARAVEDGARPTPEGKPSDWPPGQPWLHEPAPWDPDFYVARVIEPTLRGETSLVDRDLVELLELGIATLIVFADRSEFERVLELAAVDQNDRAIAGRTERLKGLRRADWSPIRWWLVARHHSWDVKEGEGFNERELRWRFDLDSDLLELGRVVLDLVEEPKSLWDIWIPAAMEILDEIPLMVSELQRKLAPMGFPAGKKPRENLSAVLRGEKPWPGRAKLVVLAKTEGRRLAPVPEWRVRLREIRGPSSAPMGSEPPSPF